MGRSAGCRVGSRENGAAGWGDKAGSQGGQRQKGGAAVSHPNRPPSHPNRPPVVPSASGIKKGYRIGRLRSTDKGETTDAILCVSYLSEPATRITPVTAASDPTLRKSGYCDLDGHGLSAVSPYSSLTHYRPWAPCYNS